MNCKCACGKILKPGYIRCSKCERDTERLAPEVAEDSSVTAAERDAALAKPALSPR